MSHHNIVVFNVIWLEHINVEAAKYHVGNELAYCYFQKQ